MWTFLTGLVILGVGGCLYGSFVERFFGVSDKPTPAVTKADGVDYVPMSSWRNGLIHLLNIAGTGPILGPIQGILFGPMAFITIPLGCILAGAVQDYMIGMISTRNDGEQIESLVKRFLGKHVAFYFGIFVLLAVLLFGVTCVYTPGDIFVKGVLKKSAEINSWYLWVVYGVIFGYYLIATLLPIDKIIGRVYPFIGGFFIFTAILLFVYIFAEKLPLKELDPSSLWSWKQDPVNKFFPIFFVTVACGIASGFHATQATIISRTLTHEREGRKIFYNMMLVEGFIAMIWAAVTMGVIELYDINTTENATNMLAEIIDDVLKVFNIDNSSPHDDLVYVVGKLFSNGIDIVVILGVIVLPITSGDTALRSCRLMAGEMLGVDQSKPENRLKLGAAIFALTAVLLFVAKLSNSGFQLLWRYFAWANQTIVVFSLAVATAWCIKEGKSIWVTVLPGAFYLTVTSSFILSAPIGFNLHWLVADIIAAVLALAYIIYFVNLKKMTSLR